MAGLDAIAARIEWELDQYALQAFIDGPRTHLGASVVGHNCNAYIWLQFHWMRQERINARQARLFNRGHLEEDRVISWLHGIGFTVRQVDIDGKQLRIADCSGHFGGSCDGTATLPVRYGIADEFLLEFKTANQNNFPDIKNTGVLKAKPRYWTQMCVYGYKMNLKYALFIAVAKNDDDIDVEVLKLDWEVGKAEIAKAADIINSPVIPKKLSHDPSYWECKCCSMHKVCHLKETPDKNCRSCEAAQPVEDKQWKCNLWNQIIPAEFIAKGCDSWTPLKS